MKEKYDISGMSCAACQAHVNKAVTKLNGIKSCNVNLLQNNMTVEYDETVCSSSMIINSIKDAGYGASLQNGEKKEKATVKEEGHGLKELIIAGVLLLALMYFSMGNMMWNFPSPKVFDMKANPMGFALIQFILVLPILYIYRSYFISGYKKLFRKAPNMDTLIAIGATFSMLYGIFSLFMISYGLATDNNEMVERYHMNLYFESAGMILVFVSIGKYLEGLSKKKTTDALTKMMDLAPKTATLLKDGNETVITADEIKVNDILVVKKGESIPTDGVIVEGNASIDQSNITGESMPVYKSLNEEVYSSTIITAGYIKIKALKENKDSSISNIIRLVEEASNSKAPISKLADKISGIFVPTILIIALLTFIVNFIVVRLGNFSYVSTGAFETALNFAITVIVIACPCALGLATPVAIMVGVGKGAGNGLLIKNAEILEKASKISTVVFDKTGTITEGKPKVTDFINISNDDNLLNVLYSFENRSEHPLALAIIEYCKKENASLTEVSSYASIEGKGIKGMIGEDSYYIGNNKDSITNDGRLDKFAKEGKTSLIITKNDKLAGIIAVKDEIKATSKEAVKELKSKNINVIMLTGDNKDSAKAIADECGIDNVIAEVLPDQKADVINSLKKDDRHLVAMVGDGVNDAIALTSADLGISVSGGSDVALESSDIVLIRNDLMDVLNVVSLSKRVLNTIKLGLFWAFFYNSICVILATGVFYYLSKGSFKMQPMYGSIAMSISSVSVCLNALTINFFKVKEVKDDSLITVKVKGMMCNKCISHVENACMKVDGVISAKASLEAKNVVVTVSKKVDRNELVKNIINEGYKAR